jgi:hypothetical protein
VRGGEERGKERGGKGKREGRGTEKDGKGASRFLVDERW